ncbi:MAG: hypothetical protein ABJB97_06380 [Acidobacteriota bacterium]
MSTKSQAAHVQASTITDGPSKADLERQMEEARESLSQTVKEIKDTVTGQYEVVRETVSGVLDYREQFQKEPVVWSLGALSAGFALGYTIGYAHKNTKGSKRKHSQIAAFADSLAGELSTVGKTMVMPTLNLKIKELFGFDFAEVLEEMGHANASTTKRKGIKRLPAKVTKTVKTRKTVSGKK